MIKFIFHFVGISDFQCVDSFTGFLWTLQSTWLYHCIISESSVKKIVGIFFEQC